MKVVSNSPGLVDFTIGLVNSVLNPPNWLVKVLGEFELLKNCNQFCSSFSLLYWHKLGAQQHGCSWVKMNSTNWSSPNVWVFIAQLVEHCRANAEAMGSNPVEVPKFFSR